MDQQEALAQALHDAYMDSDRPTAAAILDALPEGARFMSGGDFMEALDDANDTGARQERERWEAALAKHKGPHSHSDSYGNDSSCINEVLARFALPDEETP